MMHGTTNIKHSTLIYLSRTKLFPFLTENTRMTGKRRWAVRILNQSRPLPSCLGLRSRLDGCCAELSTAAWNQIL